MEGKHTLYAMFSTWKTVTAKSFGHRNNTEEIIVRDPVYQMKSKRLGTAVYLYKGIGMIKQIIIYCKISSSSSN